MMHNFSKKIDEVLKDYDLLLKYYLGKGNAIVDASSHKEI